MECEIKHTKYSHIHFERKKNKNLSIALTLQVLTIIAILQLDYYSPKFWDAMALWMLQCLKVSKVGSISPAIPHPVEKQKNTCGSTFNLSTLHDHQIEKETNHWIWSTNLDFSTVNNFFKYKQQPRHIFSLIAYKYLIVMKFDQLCTWMTINRINVYNSKYFISWQATFNILIIFIIFLIKDYYPYIYSCSLLTTLWLY